MNTWYLVRVSRDPADTSICIIKGSRTGIMTGYKIIDFCLQKSIEIVGIHSVEVERKAWHESTHAPLKMNHI